MKGGLLVHQQDGMGRMTPSKRERPFELIGFILAVLAVVTFLFIANFGFGGTEMAP
jgi:hypothetical protein